MNSGEIGVLGLERANCRAEPLAAHLRIYALVQLVVVDEQRVVMLTVAPHGIGCRARAHVRSSSLSWKEATTLSRIPRKPLVPSALICSEPP